MARKKTKEEDLSSLMASAVAKSKNIDVLSVNDDYTPLVVRDVLSTGLPNIDRILSVSKDGRWGIPVGKIISIKSKPSVGKTTLLLKIADQAIKRGGAAQFIESEHALDLDYARKIISNADKLLISQPDTLEEAFDTAKEGLKICAKIRAVDSDAPFVIIMDSFSGFSPASEFDGDFSTGGKALGEHARIASLACRKLTGPIAKAKAILLLSHQVKSKIGVFWGSNETNIGGDAFNYHDSICLSLYRTAAIKNESKRIIGHFGKGKTTKNKLYPPHREINFKVINGKGFNQAFSILDFLMERGIIVKKGSWFNFKDDKSIKWQGVDGFSALLRKNKKAKKIALGSLK